MCNVKITAASVIEKLHECFPTFGIPTTLGSNNSPPFNSEEFNTFCRADGISPSASYHPKSNGLAEKGVQTLQQNFKNHVIYDKKEG
ncbi:hypothetical protein PR048_028846, partial [Dryococelus australis]